MPGEGVIFLTRSPDNADIPSTAFMNRILTRLLTTAVSLAITTAASLAAELKFTHAPRFFEEQPDGQQLGPCHGGVVIDKSGQFYVTTDTPRGIVVFSPEGRFVRAFGPTRIHALELREEN